MGLFSDLAETFAGDSIREGAKEQASERIDAATESLEAINPQAAALANATLKQVVNESVIANSSVDELQKYDALLNKVEEAAEKGSLENASEILADSAEVGAIAGQKVLQSPDLQNQINGALEGLGTMLEGGATDNLFDQLQNVPNNMQDRGSRGIE